MTCCFVVVLTFVSIVNGEVGEVEVTVDMVYMMMEIGIKKHEYISILQIYIYIHM